MEEVIVFTLFAINRNSNFSRISDRKIYFLGACEVISSIFNHPIRIVLMHRPPVPILMMLYIVMLFSFE